MNHAPKKTAKPVKGMCGEMSCNPLGQYACCIGFIVSDKNAMNFPSHELLIYPVSNNQSYISAYINNCWQPPENTPFLIG
jgi:hypothetical protein